MRGIMLSVLNYKKLEQKFDDKNVTLFLTRSKFLIQ